MSEDEKLDEAIRLLRGYVWQRWIQLIGNGASEEETAAAIKRDLRMGTDANWRGAYTPRQCEGLLDEANG